jgi:hypothetical protein
MNNLAKLNFCEQYLSRVIENIPHDSLKAQLRAAMFEYMQGVVNSQRLVEMPRSLQTAQSRVRSLR